ncbi:unnamed protein product [Prorocentrum cordatum]|uniref:Uncharacterized protein n=1 Tax=Prorocentrum cordatum TaxID=2364126 RepID=A0ABN9TCN6_9DINO|nr:unnamed protein product [Polarella glacialis]
MSRKHACNARPMGHSPLSPPPTCARGRRGRREGAHGAPAARARGHVEPHQRGVRGRQRGAAGFPAKAGQAPPGQPRRARGHHRKGKVEKRWRRTRAVSSTRPQSA